MIRFVSWAPNQNIINIYEASCDTKDWNMLNILEALAASEIAYSE